MSEPKTRPTDASVEDFVAAQAPARREDCQAIIAMMRNATGEPPVMWGEAIVGFGRVAIARSDGKAYDWPLIAFSPRKNEFVLYLTDDYEVYAQLMSQLGRHRTGKACLYIKRLADIDRGVLERLIDATVRASKPNS